MNSTCYETNCILKQSNYSALMSPSTRIASTAHLGGIQKKKSADGTPAIRLGFHQRRYNVFNVYWLGGATGVAGGAAGGAIEVFSRELSASRASLAASFTF